MNEIDEFRRKILFRAWDIEKKCFVKGNFLTIDCTGNTYFTDKETGKKIDNLILSQYTGLQDKNGKEIFEGDVLKFQTHTTLDNINYSTHGVVFFGEYQQCFFDYDRGDIVSGWWLRLWRGSRNKRYEEGYILDNSTSEDKEILGNIFEHPDPDESFTPHSIKIYFEELRKKMDGKKFNEIKF